MNNVSLVGRCGKDPESFGDGKVVKVTLATSHRVKKGDQWEEETEWHTIVCFGKLGENVSKFVTKGQQLAVTGRIHYTSHEKDGVTRYYTEILAQNVEFLSGGQQTQTQQQKPVVEGTPVDEDGLPF